MVFNQPISTNHFFMSQFPSFGSWSSWKDKASLESPASWTASNDWRVVPMFRTAFSYPFSIGKSHAKWLTSSEIVMSALKNYHFLFGNLMPSGLNHLQSPYLPHFFTAFWQIHIWSSHLPWFFPAFSEVAPGLPPPQPVPEASAQSSARVGSRAGSSAVPAARRTTSWPSRSLGQLGTCLED